MNSLFASFSAPTTSKKEIHPAFLGKVVLMMTLIAFAGPLGQFLRD